MRKVAGTLVGKTVAAGLKLRGKSSGQALPGLIVEKLVPGYLTKMLAQLPQGVVVVTGTNGKTTTTKMVVELLRANHVRVLTNATGSNLNRGIISSVSQQATKDGKLPFDIAIFELDEAYAKRFIDRVRPRMVLALNASRDQLDRFGEVDMVARLVGDTMLAATEAIVVNADDKRLSAIAAHAEAKVSYYGVSTELLKFFPRDDELVAVNGPTPTLQAASVPMDVELRSFKDDSAVYKIEDQEYEANLQVTGQHNFQNAAGALALMRLLLPDVPTAGLIRELAVVQPAFGRGEQFRLKNGSTLQLTLVKNPASFRQGLASYVTDDTGIMIAINDNIADSRDMSWLWDIDFTSLRGRQIALTTGSRAVDMALRLKYDEVDVTTVEPNLSQALRSFCDLPSDKVVFASYTAMLRLYDLLKRDAGTKL